MGVEWMVHPWPGKQVLNLGCGRRPMRNAVNHDRSRHHDWVDVTWDFEAMPWPHDGAYDVVAAFDVPEHVTDVLGFANECWRLVVPDGLLEMRAAAWDNPATFIDPTHRHWFAEETWQYLDPTTRLGEHYGTYYRDSLGRAISPWRLLRVARTNPDPRWPDRGDWLVTLERR